MRRPDITADRWPLFRQDGEITRDGLEEFRNFIAETSANITDVELPRVTDDIGHLIHDKADEQARQMQYYQNVLEDELRLLTQASEAAANVQPSSRTIEANEVDERSGQYLDAGPTDIFRNVVVRENKSTRESMQYIGDMSQYKPEMMGHMARPTVAHVATPAATLVIPGAPADVNIVGINKPVIYPTAGPAPITTASSVNKPPVPSIEASRVSENDAGLRDIRTLSAARAGRPAEAAVSVRPRSQQPTEAAQGAETDESWERLSLDHLGWGFDRIVVSKLGKLRYVSMLSAYAMLEGITIDIAMICPRNILGKMAL